MPTQHQKCLLESTQTGEIICMFLLALLCVDWQMLCLSYSVMFACQRWKRSIFSFSFFFYCIIKLDTTKTVRALWRCAAAENSPAALSFLLTVASGCLNSLLWYIQGLKDDKAFSLAVFNLGLLFLDFAIRMIDRIHYHLMIWRRLLTPIFPLT